ncbi:hypothetical protein [Mesohalobacter halotolerans]|uniref:Uncharacterized protein n=1 Tax=Mesohalobacter halotolerans TaxID=1883405 RepID=A0A4U5TR15_9FLAO|nr:hypothetical protein [Mesohalobacter halotolerans]MBS3739137.1 hypothetical protein [Psychroflexus sp.]TKS56667.1 hypothetical protein FCN74_06460 [Mesohalobacter halotolerans]
MFTTGQWIFAAFFVVAFIVLMLLSYKKDKVLHQKYYKGSFYILLGFLAFVLILFLMKTFLKS